MFPKQSKEEVEREMLDFLGRAKECGALAYIILQTSLLVKYRAGEKFLAESLERLEAVRALPDTAMFKEGSLESSHNAVECYTHYQEEMGGVLAMLKDIEQGNYPSDWLAVPAWSRRYSFEGHTRHHLARTITMMQLWARENEGIVLNKQQMIAKILRYTEFLAPYREEIEKEL